MKTEPIEKEPVHVEEWMVELAREIIRNVEGGNEDSVSLAIVTKTIQEYCPRFTVNTWDKPNIGKFPCPKCGHTVKMTMAPGAPFNSGQMSFLAIAHKPATCEKCGREFVPFVTGGNLQCAIAEVKPESSIIQPASSLLA